MTTKINYNKINLLAASLVLATLVAFPVLAQTTGTTVQNKATAVSVATIIDRADKEIDQRVSDLNNLILRIEAMKKISVAGQNGLTSVVQNEINELLTLKAKIDAEVTAAAAKIDYQSITKSYRVYVLVLPQTRIIAASDRVLTIIDSINIVGNKVKSRISSLTGTNSATINQKFTDFTAKVNDASVQAKAASNEVLSLQPDQGDKTKMQANTAALKDARAKLKAATDDLNTARKDIGDIAKYLKENAGTATRASVNTAAPAQ